MKLGEIIRKIRQSKGLTLEDVAYAAGTDAGNLSRIERGLQRCVHELLEGIAAGLGLSVAELYLQVEASERAGSGQKPIHSKKKSQAIVVSASAALVCQYEQLNESNQRLVNDFVQLLLRNQRQK